MEGGGSFECVLLVLCANADVKKVFYLINKANIRLPCGAGKDKGGRTRRAEQTTYTQYYTYAPCCFNMHMHGRVYYISWCMSVNNAVYERMCWSVCVRGCVCV